MNASISPTELHARLDSGVPPIVIDVRKAPTFRGASDMISGALRRDPAAVEQWARSLPHASTAVVYCVHGHEVSQNAAKALREAGIPTQFLEGGIEEGWRASGGSLDRKAADASTRWVTRERPKIDRIACPWLISRFIDPGAEFIYVPTPKVVAVAKQVGGTPYDIEGVEFALEGCAHGAPRAVEHGADIERLARRCRLLAFDEFAHAGFEDARQRAVLFAAAAGALVQGMQVAAGPEAAFEFFGLGARGADGEHLAENIGPASQRDEQQQRHDQLHDQVSMGDQGNEGEVLWDVVHGVSVGAGEAATCMWAATAAGIAQGLRAAALTQATSTRALASSTAPRLAC